MSVGKSGDVVCRSALDRRCSVPANSEHWRLEAAVVERASSQASFTSQSRSNNQNKVLSFKPSYLRSLESSGPTACNLQYRLCGLVDVTAQSLHCRILKGAGAKEG